MPWTSSFQIVHPTHSASHNAEHAWRKSQQVVRLSASSLLPRSHPPPFSPECETFRYALFQCRKGQVDARTRIQGNKGY